jgi:hypothetical protein
LKWIDDVRRGRERDRDRSTVVGHARAGFLPLPAGSNTSN